MPPSTDILNGLAAIANDRRLVAIGWHSLLGALLLGLVSSWRPLTRDIGLLLVAPLVSVSTLAWMSGNPGPGALVLSAAGVVYGAIGVFRLGVGIDAVLVAGALWVGIATIRGSFIPKRENDSRARPAR